jgi:hypothetical protein
VSTNKQLLIVSMLSVLVACGDDDESRDGTTAHDRGSELGADSSRRPDAREEREWIEEMGEDDESEDAPADEPAPPSLPVAIVGSWFAGAGNTTQPYDPSTQSYGTPSGSGVVFTFRADGTYSKAFRSQVSNGGCSTGLSAYEAGVAQVDGDTLRIIPMTGTLSYRDTCVPSLDSDRQRRA